MHPRNLVMGFMMLNFLFSVQCFIEHCQSCYSFSRLIIPLCVLRFTSSDYPFGILKSSLTTSAKSYSTMCIFPFRYKDSSVLYNETVNNLPALQQINFTRNDKPEYTVNFPKSNVSFELNYIYFRYMTQFLIIIILVLFNINHVSTILLEVRNKSKNKNI